VKYIIYLRVSTDQQEVEAQLYESLSYVKSRAAGKPFQHVVFSDPETTSRVKMTKRKGLMDMLDSMRKDDLVVTYKLDRLSRDVIEMVTIYRMIKDRKCDIHSLNDPYCDEFTVGLMGVLAQKERFDISTRTASKLADKKRKSLRYSGKIPYGYTLDTENLIEIKRKGESPVMKPGILVECPRESFVISIAQAMLESGLSYRSIAGRLADLGYYNREGKPFDPKTVYRFLTRLEQPKTLQASLQT